MPRLSKIGAAALAAFGWTTGGASVSASYLVVAGGAGSAGYNGGGAGAGGLLTGTTSLNPTLSYTITVGAGGTAGNNASGSRGTNGADSVFSAFTSVGGGTSGSASGTLSVVNGSTGGSGGGAGGATGTNATVASGTSGQGNAGGDNFNSGGYGAGGGGGASAVGANGTTSVSGNGGAGNAVAGNTISNTNYTFKLGSPGFDSEIYFQNTSSTPLYRAKGGSGGLGGNTAWPPGTLPSGQEPLAGGSGGGNGARDDGAGGLLSTLNIVNGSLVSVINNIESDSVNPSYIGEQCFGNEGGRGGGNDPWLGSGGGGAGTRGTDVNTLGNPGANNAAGVGGSGKVINILGTNITYAGGGGGGNFSGGSSYFNDGGSGGGGRSGTSSVAPVAGTDGTGGGGGGDGPDVFNGAKGGSGIVIIRYRLPATSSTSSSINFIRGTTTDTNNDYKVGNFNGEFKVISSVTSGTSNIDTDYIRITTAGAITNPSGTANWNIGSDRRIKENIERASYDKCFENINRLELNRFNYISGFNTVNRDRTQLGFIAQEVYDIFPKSISTQGYYSDTLNIPDLLSIDVSQINYSLYGAVKKLIEINNDKDNRLKALDDELKTIETILNITPDTVASNVVLEPVISMTSNVVLEEMTSNITVDS